MNIIAITQARVGSTRLPSKVLKKIGDETLLEVHLNRILEAKTVSKLIVATTVKDADQAIVDLVEPLGIQTYRGSEDDVLDRFYQAVKREDAEYVVRITSDCPLVDPVLIDQIVQFTIDGGYDYCSNTLKPTYPDGQDVEVFKFSALETAWKDAKLLSEREHVTPYIKKNSTFYNVELFKSFNYENDENFEELRMTVDEQVDFDLMEAVIEALGTNKRWKAYADFILENPNILSLNADIIRDEGYLKSLEKDKQN